MPPALYPEFLRIARALNNHGLVPLLAGSVGLEQVTGVDWRPGDLDVWVRGDERGWDAPDDERLHDWPVIEAVMTGLGYRLVDPHEHAFAGPDGAEVEFGVLDSLPSFAGVPVACVPRRVDGGATYLLPTAEQFLALYRASRADGYRAVGTEHKDDPKIRHLEGMLS